MRFSQATERFRGCSFAFFDASHMSLGQTVYVGLF